jgi:hypothetical protein
MKVYKQSKGRGVKDNDKKNINIFLISMGSKTAVNRVTFRVTDLAVS